MTVQGDTILAELGRFTSTIACASLPPEIVQKAQACVLYGLAVAVASVRAPQAWQAAQAVDREGAAGAAGGALRLIDQRRLDFPLAAFCNAVLLHSRVQDDAHPCGHLGVVVLPTALACAERFNASGKELLAAMVAGYEVALRIGRDHAADLSSRGFRTTPAYGVFAAAACGARLMQLDAGACANALSLAANAAGGLREWVDAGTEEYPFQPGLAARNGLMCANLAAAGTVAAKSALTGRAGFFRAYGTDSDRYAARVCAGLGKEFEMAVVTFKPYPICQFLCAVVRGTLDLRARAHQAGFRSLAIHMHPFEADFIGNRFTGPYSSFQQTMISAPFCSALAWSSEAVTFAGLHEFTNPAILDLVRKVTVVTDAARARYAPRLIATLEDGAIPEWQPTPGENPFRLTWDAAVEMNGALCAEAGVTTATAQALVSAVAGLANAAGVDQLIAAASACAAEACRHAFPGKARP